jgi:hypothetical protein
MAESVRGVAGVVTAIVSDGPAIVHSPSGTGADDPMENPSPVLGELTVVIGGRAVGTVRVAEQTPRKVTGQFVPSSALGPYRTTFEAAVDLASQFDATPTDEPCDYALFDRVMDAYARITDLGPTFAEIPSPIDEFAIGADWSVEVYLNAAPPYSPLNWGSD